MNCRNLRVFLSFTLFIGISNISLGQVLLMGMVADSASLQALPYVNVE